GRRRRPDGRARRLAGGRSVTDQSDARERWRRTRRAAALRNAPERRERFETTSGIEISDVYTAADLAGLDEERDLGLPGEFPFTRGVQPTMYRSRLWTMRQYAGFATAAETNRRFRYLLEQGQTGLSVAFDLPTQMGYDSDAPEAEGEVGRVGVPISSLADMETLVDGIPLGEVSTSMTINATAATLVALYVAAAIARGMAIDDFAPRLSFFFAAWSELFEEVAKFRAARRMWARIVRDRFGSSNVRSMACRFHVQTAGSSLTAQSVDNNVVRTTVQALAAILGGAQSLHTNARDEALAL